MTRMHLLAIELNAVWHCNLACVACTHASPVARDGLADPETVRRDLANLHEIADIDEVRVLGGEPLLHPDLPAVLTAIRESGLNSTVRVSTNGTRLRAGELAWVDLVDEIHVSRYPGTRVRDDAVEDLTRICAEQGKTLILKDFHSFRHFLPVEELSAEQAKAVFDTCQQAHAWSCHTVHEGHVYMCPNTADPMFHDREACPIEPVATLPERLAAFLNRTEPLRACSTCLGTVGNRFEHQQAGKRTWLPLTKAGHIDDRQLAAVRADPLADNGCSSHEVLVDSGQESHWVGWRS